MEFAVLTASSRLTDFCFSRLTSKLRRTQRLATGKSTSTLSSTPSVQPPRSKKRIQRNQQVAHPPRQMGRVPPPTHQQRSGLEKCLVRLLGRIVTPHQYQHKKIYILIILLINILLILTNFKLCPLPLSDRGRPPATRVLAKPLPWGHPPLWITQQSPSLPRIKEVKTNPPSSGRQ